MKTQDIKNIATALKGIREAAKKKEEGMDYNPAKGGYNQPKGKPPVGKRVGTREAMDPVDKKELKGKHKDRKDKDIDNDGDVDSSDKFLHKRRKAVSKAIAMASKKKSSAEKDAEAEVQESKQNIVEAKLMSDDDVAKMVAKKLGNKKNTDRYDQIAVIKGILNKSPKQKSLATDREFIDGVLDILFKKYNFISNQRESVDVKVQEAALDEISKKTLGSYIKKAAADKADNAYNLGARDPLGKKGSWSKSFKRRKGIAMATDKLTKESKNHGNMNNGSPAGEGLTPNGKKMMAMKTPMPDAVNEPVVDKKTFDAIRASGKKAAMRSGDNAQGDKTPPKNDGK